MDKVIFTYGEEEVEMVDYFVALMSRFFREAGAATYFILDNNPEADGSGNKYSLTAVHYHGPDDFLADLAMGFAAGWRAKSGESVDDILAQ